MHLCVYVLWKFEARGGLMWFLGTELWPLRELQVLLITEPSLQPPLGHFLQSRRF